MKQKVEIETLIEIEKIICSRNQTGKYDYLKIDEVIGKDTNYNAYYAQAFNLANLMPISEISKAIKEYDEIKPKMDELLFVSRLAEKYEVSRGEVITRVQHVRRINNEIMKMTYSKS